MYQGIAFSPQAFLAENIGAADTIIKVTDISAFPDAPNYATIGTEEDGETIIYAAKTADSLSGCTRGAEGSAKAWNAGEIIARNFTARDQADLIAAINAAATDATNAGSAAASAAMLAAAVKARTFSVALPVSGWSDNRQTVSHAGFLTGNYAYLIAADADSQESYAAAKVKPADDVTTAGQLTFTCVETPERALTVFVARWESDNVGT